MCRACSSVMKAIDAYLAKAEDSLADALEAEGYAKPKKTMRYLRELEDSVAEALTEETEEMEEHVRRGGTVLLAKKVLTVKTEKMASRLMKLPLQMVLQAVKQNG